MYSSHNNHSHNSQYSQNIICTCTSIYNALTCKSSKGPVFPSPCNETNSLSSLGDILHESVTTCMREQINELTSGTSWSVNYYNVYMFIYKFINVTEAFICDPKIKN